MDSTTQVNLVADVGGTNTRVGLAIGPTLQTETVRKYKNAAHRDLETVLTTFLHETGRDAVNGACIAVAGPVTEDGGELTNLAWSFSKSSLQRATGATRAAILNDLQAQGHGLSGLDQTRVRTIFKGAQSSATAAKLVVGVGTGFNAAPVFSNPTSKIVPPCECGHGPMPVTNEQELAIARHLTAEHGYAEVEEVISGRGLINLYAYVARTHGQDKSPDAATIMDSVIAGDDPIATETVRQFIRTLAISVGHLAMVQLPFGGIYLIGGVARAMAPHFDQFDFVPILQDKGRFTDFMRAFPIHLVEDDFAALVGCADHLANQTA